MSVNKYAPHIVLLPEDDANRQIANGFLLGSNLNSRSVQILPPARGWLKVLNAFTKVHVPKMRQVPNRMVVLLIDFDRKEDRFTDVGKEIPEDVKDRVFVLGVLSEPEELKRDTGKSFEDIGKILAKDCSENTNELWKHDLLKHNETELERMILSVKPFLFGA